MTSKQIESLVQQAENRMHNEFGEYPCIGIHGYDSGYYEVQFCWDHAGIEHSEIAADNLSDDELTHFLTNDVDSYLREFYFRMNNGRTINDKAHVLLADFVAKEQCIPTDVYVDIRWKKDGEICKHYCICCDRKAQDAAPSSKYFFHCESIKGFFRLLRRNNGEDFDIIDIYGWD